MARGKLINYLGRLFCFRSPSIPHGDHADENLPSSPLPLPSGSRTDENLAWIRCGIHGGTGTATGSCTCGFDTLRALLISMARGKFINCLGRLFCFHLPSASMAREKLINCLGRLFCFRSPSVPHGDHTDENLPSRPPPFPCGSHTGTATGSCTCGLDTLRYGSFDFHEIEDQFRALLFNQAQSSNETEVSTQEEEQSIGAAHFFTPDEIDEAKHCFDPVRQLGEGGYSTVYLGKLKDGQMVAIKVLKEYDSDEVAKYIMEINLFCNLRHQNLVRLYGCTPGGQELILVYEYMSNGNVAEHLYGHRKTEVLTWDRRIQIAIETAEAIKYLHFHVVQSIIHCDIKTDNILFDDSFHVKVGDFGLSNPHTSSRRGTVGYLDPEYDNDGILTDKSDVYSFGVVLLELISGQMAVDVTRNESDIFLESFAPKMIRNKELEQLVDPNLEYESDSEIRRMVNQVGELACLCLQSEREKRPSMAEVVYNLKWIRDNKDPGIEHVDLSLPAQTQTADLSDLVALLRVRLQGTGFIDFLEQIRSSYGHKLSTILLFFSFVHPKYHAAVPENDNSPWGTACGCHLYLQNNRILEGLADSECFINATFSYIAFLGSIGDLPLPVAQRIVNYVRALNPTE